MRLFSHGHRQSGNPPPTRGVDRGLRRIEALNRGQARTLTPTKKTLAGLLVPNHTTKACQAVENPSFLVRDKIDDRISRADQKEKAVHRFLECLSRHGNYILFAIATALSQNSSVSGADK